MRKNGGKLGKSGVDNAEQCSCHAYAHALRPTTTTQTRQQSPFRLAFTTNSVLPLRGLFGPSPRYRLNDIIPSQPTYCNNYQKWTAYNRNLVLNLLLLPSAGQPSKPHHRAELQAILLPNHALVLLPKLTCQLFASCYVLRTDEIDRDLDRICQIGNLKNTVIGQLLPSDRTPRNTPDVHIPPV